MTRGVERGERGVERRADARSTRRVSITRGAILKNEESSLTLCAFIDNLDDDERRDSLSLARPVVASFSSSFARGGGHSTTPRLARVEQYSLEYNSMLPFPGCESLPGSFT